MKIWKNSSDQLHQVHKYSLPAQVRSPDQLVWKGEPGYGHAKPMSYEAGNIK
jgi:hypothetical protein